MANPTKTRLLVVFGVTVATVFGQTPPSSGPQAYSGMPTTPYGPDWQQYFEVTAPLPNISFTMPRTYAGSVSVNRSGHPNNTLFFVAFEKQDGSLAAADGERSNEPWTIWLNGGPGSSSMYGLFTENGPLQVSLADGAQTNNTLVMKQNPYSWHNLTDIFYIDQPVGTGYSTSDATGYIVDEDQMGTDFAGFLTNIVAVFPSLKQRPLYITGESYAGTYIPYISKTIVATSPRPVNLAKIAIGDGAIGNYGAFVEYSALSVLQTYPQLIGFSTSAYEYFVDQFNLCGYNLTLQYPAPSDYPTLRVPATDFTNSGFYSKNIDAIARMKSTLSLYKLKEDDAVNGEIEVNGRKLVKRQQVTPPPLAPTGVIDPWYKCFVMEHIEEYATNYTAPWQNHLFDVYRIPNLLSPPAPDDASFFLNDPAVRAAFHAPDKEWQLSIRYPFGSRYSRTAENPWGDPSPASQGLLSDLSVHVSMIFYSGNDDALVGHRGTELAIQNFTFGGIRGFTARPSTPFSDTDGNFAGIIHQERNVTYALFDGAGHMVPTNKPKAAYAFLREFVLGNNQTGLLTSDGNIVGGIHTEYQKGILTASEAYTGALTTGGVFTWAAESWAAWGSYMAARTAADAPVASATGDGAVQSGRPNSGVESYTLGQGSMLVIISAILGNLL